ncbi:hypothetical protein NFI96_034326 [Prochilodus magdalenae]|nr:hypothetical protein NFI96_034326 [Prochilodus magdalenae]
MNEEKGKDEEKRIGNHVLMSKNGFPFDPWHSTPVKKTADETSMARQTATSPPAPSNHLSSLSLMRSSRTSACEMEVSTIQKQRMELQLLMAELKDRDQELNTMAAAHHRQLQAWEQDRQRVLTLEQRCARLEDELQKRNQVIRAISKRLKIAEAREKDIQRELNTAQQLLKERSQKEQQRSQQQHNLEEKNQSMNSTIMALSSQVGQLQVHEEELSSMLKLKDIDLMEATNHILALTSRLQESEASLNESRTRERIMLRETEKYKGRFREARHDNVQLKDELQEKTIENNSQREELIRLKQENQLFRKELALAGEDESCKDELLVLARSKQERTESELLCLRQVCEKQLNDLQLLKLNLESTREALRRYESQRSFESTGDVTCLYVECPTLSPLSRSPAPLEDSALNSKASSNQVAHLIPAIGLNEALSVKVSEKLRRSTPHLQVVCSAYWQSRNKWWPVWNALLENLGAPPRAPPPSVALSAASVLTITMAIVTATPIPPEIARKNGNKTMTSKTKNEKTDKSEKALAAEKEQFVKLQWLFFNISAEILLGTHKEGGAVTFWSHAVSLPLSSSAILSWKFCHMVHKLLRDGHPNTMRDSRGHVPSIRQMGTLWGSLHDRYGHIVALYAKFLCIKIEFHCKHKEIPGNLETPDEVLERAIAIDINKVFETTGEVLDYMDAALLLQETGIPVDALLGHRERFRDQFDNLTQFFEKARGMEFFKTIIQIPDLPDSPPNFLRAAALADHVKPVVVRNQELPDDDDTETQLDFGEVPGYQMYYAYNQYDPPNDIPVQRETEVDSLRKELEAVKPELQLFKAEAQRAVVQLKDQVNKLEAELEEQRTHKQMALVENEHLRMEVEALRTQSAVAASIQASAEDAGSRAQTAQMHFSRLKEKHAELVTRHADLMRKNTETVKQLSSTQQTQEELIRTKQQMAEELEKLRQDKYTKDHAQAAEILRLKQELESRRAEITHVQSALQGKEKAGDQLSSVLVGLQTDKESLLRSVKEQETELAKLRQTAQLHQATLQQERENSQREMSSLQSQLHEKVYREQEQQLEMDKLRRELELKRAEALSAQTALHSKEASGDQLSSVLLGLQAEKDMLLRSLKEQETELAKLRQAAQLHQATLQQERERSQREMSSLQSQLQQILRREQEQQMEIARLKRELEERRAEAFSAQSALNSKEMAGDEINTVLVGLQAEKDVLLRSVKEQEAELVNLRQATKLHQATLVQERERSQREMSSLQSQLQAKASRESVLQQKLQEEQFCLLQCAVVEAEGIILDAVAKVDDPMHVRCVSTPEYLINRAETTLVSIDKMQQSHAGYMRNMDEKHEVHYITSRTQDLQGNSQQFTFKISPLTSLHPSPGLTDNCRDCATHCLQFLKELKLKATLQRADPTAIRYVVQRILNQGHDLRHKDGDIQKAELADMVDMEMAATSTAIEDAVLRMDEILSQARRDTSGIKLEVNQSIIGSCSDLMKAIHMLVTAATDLQKDIVESGRGAGSVKDFYAKNSCWTEGLISASKTVGWAATQMVESADKVVTDQGKYEELIVCSHEIAASTAQLVAASKVKADRGNKKLHTLQHASRHVNDMAAVVVTSTKAGQMQIEEKNPMDFSGLSLIKLKTEEMESQVRVLELESKLSSERQRLGELRKRHYDLAGGPLDQPVARNFDRFTSHLPSALPELPLPEPPLPEPPLPEPHFMFLPDLPLPDPPLPELPLPEPPLPEPSKPEPTKSTSSKRSSIFHRSGAIFKSAFR